MEEVYKQYDITPGTKPLGEGVEATVFPLDDERVVRVYKSGREAQRAKLELMQDFYDSLDDSGVGFKVPKILSISVSNGVVSTVDTRLIGKDFGSVYDVLDTSTKHKTLLNYLAASQQIRHLKPPYPFFGEVLSDNPIRESTWREFLSRKIHDAYQKGKDNLQKDIPEVKRIVEYMESEFTLFDNVTEASLVHGDYYLANVLVEDGEVSAVLDFNDLTLAGDFRMDIASAVIFLGDEDTGNRDADRQILIDELFSHYGEGIKDIIHFYKLYYALVFASYSKDTDSSTYHWAIKTLRQQIENSV